MTSPKKISLKDWQEIKPYNKTSKTDLYYHDICNQINTMLYEENFHIALVDFVREEGISLFSIFITSYFEDIISGTNIWNSFTRKHRELYGKPFPFYTPDEFYIEGEVNKEDVKFLIWYFISVTNKNSLLNPNDPFYGQLAEKIVEILVPEYEFAPENKLLKECYEIKDENDYYEVRKLMDTILTKTYLFFPDTGFILLKTESEIIQKEQNHTQMILEDNRDLFVHHVHTKLLAMTGKEWAQLILGENHPVSKELEHLSPKIQGSFLYKGKDDSTIFLEHIATGRKIDLKLESYDNHKNLDENKIVFLGIIQWKGEWWFSGITIVSDLNEEVIENEKQNLYAKNAFNFLNDQDLAKELVGKHHQAFLDFNKGLPIAFLKKNDVEAYINGFFDYFNETIDKDEKEKSKALKKFKPKMEKSEEEYTGETGVIFHNEKSGFEVYANIDSAFHVKGNEFLNKEKSDQDFMQLFIADFYSPEIVHYAIEQGKKKIEFFKNKKNQYAQDDLDFLIRFFKHRNYHTQPKITVSNNQ